MLNQNKSTKFKNLKQRKRRKKWESERERERERRSQKKPNWQKRTKRFFFEKFLETKKSKKKVKMVYLWVNISSKSED